MEENNEVVLKSAISTYEALRAESITRIVGQGRAAAGAVALVSGFIGVLAAVKVDGDASLIVELVRGDTEARQVFGILCAGFLLGIELLLSFWAYQLFQLFRRAHDLEQINGRLKNRFGIQEYPALLGWEHEGRSLRDIQVDQSYEAANLAVRALSYTQPLAFFVLWILGLFGMGYGISAIDSTLYVVIFIALLLGLPAIVGAMLALHKWHGGFYRPDAGMGNRNEADEN